MYKRPIRGVVLLATYLPLFTENREDERDMPCCFDGEAFFDFVVCHVPVASIEPDFFNGYSILFFKNKHVDLIFQTYYFVNRGCFFGKHPK
jgi:hypothetical protein